MSQTTPQQNHERLGNYLRTHRKKSGLSQRELGRLLGYADEGAVSRHEKSHTLPPLLTAIGYEIIFRTPMAELLPGIRLTVEQAVEGRMRELEEELQKKSGKENRAASVAHKLAWFYERRDILDE